MARKKVPYGAGLKPDSAANKGRVGASRPGVTVPFNLFLQFFFIFFDFISASNI
jgi:hypothetical protein